MFLFVLYVSDALAGAPFYAVTHLAELPESAHYGDVTGINIHGDAVGASYGSSPCDYVHAVLWQTEAYDDPIDLGPLDGCDTDSYAHAINDSGILTGNGSLNWEWGDPVRHRAFWSDGDGLAILPMPPHDPTDNNGAYAYDINNNNFIVGSASWGDHNTAVPVFWGQSGVNALPLLPDTFSGRAVAINDRDAIIGYSGSAQVVWRGGEVAELPGISALEDLNDREQIVGSLEHIGYPSEAVMLVDARGITVATGGNGINDDAALAINDRGEVVGTSDGHAFWWAWSDEEPVDLNTLHDDPDVLLTAAVDINDAGQIVALGNPGRLEVHAYLLTPVSDTLLLNGPLPVGPAKKRFEVWNATPGERLSVVYGLRAGDSEVPGCPGLEVDIERAKIVETTRADAHGHAAIDVRIPSRAEDHRVYFQAVDTTACQVSNRPDWRF